MPILTKKSMFTLNILHKFEEMIKQINIFAMTQK